MIHCISLFMDNSDGSLTVYFWWRFRHLQEGWVCLWRKEYNQYHLEGNNLKKEQKKLMLDLINALINTRIMANKIHTCLKYFYLAESLKFWCYNSLDNLRSAYSSFCLHCSSFAYTLPKDVLLVGFYN